MCNFLKRGQGHLHTKSVIVFVYGYYAWAFCKLYVLLNERKKETVGMEKILTLG